LNGLSKTTYFLQFTFKAGRFIAMVENPVGTTFAITLRKYSSREVVMLMTKWIRSKTVPAPRFEVDDLKKGVSAVMNGWPPFLSYRMGSYPGSSEPLPLRFSLEFTGPFRGLLHIRTTPGLADLLLGFQEIHGSVFSKQSAFREFRDLFASRLMAYLWSHYGTWFNSNLPTYSYQEARGFQPTARWTYFIEDWPLEMVLWFDRDGQEDE